MKIPLRWTGLAVGLAMLPAAVRCASESASSPPGAPSPMAPTDAGAAGAGIADGGPSPGGATPTGGDGEKGGATPWGTDAFPKSGQAPMLTIDPSPTLPTCGPGCRAALNAPVGHPAYWGTSSSPSGVLDVSDELAFSILFSPLGSTVTIRFAPASATEVFVQTYLHGGFVSYVRAVDPTGSIEVLDTSTGAFRSYASYDTKKSGNVPVQTALNDKYLFWNYSAGGIYRADRISGEVHGLVPGDYGCDTLCARADSLICADARVMVFDQETGAKTILAPSDAVQTQGSCSLTRGQYVFVDFRNAPSMGIGDLSGGDILVHDFASGALTPVTSDSPAHEVPKSYPGMDGDVVAWHQAPSGYVKKGALHAFDLPNIATTLAYRDLAKGVTCFYDKAPLTGLAVVSGRHIYGDFVANGHVFLGALAIDDPGVPWVCQ